MADSENNHIRFPLPLRFTIPATFFLIGLLLGIFSFQKEVKTDYRRIENEVQQRADSMGNQISNMLEYHLGIGDLEGASRQIALLTSYPTVRHGLVCDESDRILFSTRTNLTGGALSSIHADGFEMSQKVRQSKAYQIKLSPDRKTVLAVFPFHLGVGAGETPIDTPGILLLDYDLARVKKNAFNDVVGRSSAIGIALALGCLAVWWFFHKTLTQRALQLREATQRFAAGEIYAQSNLKGSDELAQISGAFNQMAAHVRDRTMELQAANAKMKHEILDRERAENRFLSVWKSSVDGMRLTDQNGNIVAANEAYCRLVGFTAEELDGKPFTFCHNAEDKIEERLAKYKERFANRNIASLTERQVTFHGGKTVDLEVASSFMAQDNEEPLLLSIFRDVSERKHTEELLQQQSASMKASFDGMAILNERGNFIFLNDAHATIYGYSDPHEMVGKSWEILYGPQELARFKEQIMPDFWKAGQWHGEAIGLRRDGTSFPQELSLSRIANGGLVCVVRDITERKQEEERRMSLDRKLLDAQKLESLGVLAGGIAHDFNNLLTAILGNASLALMQASEFSPLKPYLANIEKTSLQAAELCKQMLAYSGRGRFVVQRVNFNSLIEDMTHLFHISVSKKVVLKFNLAETISAVEADAAQIRQVVMNLVINASEAIGNQSGVISVSTGVMHADHAYLTETYLAPELPEGNYAFIEVADTGCGMTAETKAKIFDPFFTTKFTGRGLGLAAVLGIVRGHKGAMKIYSEVNRGTTFKFLLPCADAPADESATKIVTGPSWQGKGTILIVDDEEPVRTVAARMLELMGFTVLQAADGREGVEVYSKNADRITAVITDMTMPYLNGEETFREIRRLNPDARVILMSGYNEQDATNRFAGKGLGGFIQKPFKIEELRDKVRTLLPSISADTADDNPGL